MKIFVTNVSIIFVNDITLYIFRKVVRRILVFEIIYDKGFTFQNLEWQCMSLSICNSVIVIMLCRS